MFQSMTYCSLRIAAIFICSFVFILSFGPSQLFAQGDRGEGEGDRRREWVPGGPDGGGRWEERRGGRRGRRDGWNPEEFLRQRDSNGDGKLEKSEISGRTEKYLEELGFDTSKAIGLNAVVDKIRADRGEGPVDTKKEEEARRVPGFGATNEKVPGFSSGANETDISTFGQDIIRQVEWVMDNYDKNKNDVLDQSELVDIPAGPPPLADSDSNRDGRLSRLEMANRYRAREQFARRNEGQSRNTDGDEGGGAKSFRNRSDRGRFSSEPSNLKNSRSSERLATRGPNFAVREPTQKDRGVDSDQVRRTTTYVENIIKKYDSDNDGKLSVSEVEASEIRNPPPADTDGNVTKEAYVNFLINPQKSTVVVASGGSENPDAGSDAGSGGGGSGAESPRENRVKRWRTNGKTSTDLNQDNASGNSSGNSSGNKTADKPRNKVTFEDYDGDGNGMVEMHEYSQEWDDATLEQFYQKDKNRDGVITSKEWKGY